MRKRSFASKLSVGILFLALPIFVLSMGILFYVSRQKIRSEAVGHANSVLSATMQQVTRKLRTIATASEVNSWLVQQYFQPDSLQAISRRVVMLNSHVEGCSISAEPDVFTEYGRYFSTYSIREGDTVKTAVEEQYEYFTRTWYQIPRELGKASWIDFFDDKDTLSLALDGMLASYCKPIYDSDGGFIAVLSSDFSLQRLSKLITANKPYPHSYFVMLNKEGRFFIHPDSTRLFEHTIFEGADPRKHSDLIALGHEMVAGNEGNMSVVINGEPCIVCYQPVPDTKWSLAVVCPDSDVLAGYHRLTKILVINLVIGMLVILLLCNKVAQHTIRPINELLEKAQSVAEGNMDVHIPHVRRKDAVGRLQNSFATMLQSLHFHIDSINQTTEELRKRNEELVEATRMAEEANRQKTDFIRYVTHQIRTPLNIISGFAQLLRESGDAQADNIATDEEYRSLTHAMDYNARLLCRLLLMLFDSSDTGYAEDKNNLVMEMTSCNGVAREAIGYINLQYPDLNIELRTEIDDSFSIKTSHHYLMITLRELLYNSSKYSDRQHISISVSCAGDKVRYVIEDTGKGIAEADLERLFQFFTKIDDLSEGLGLGLPLSKRHVQMLGGDLTLDETYHAGCRFIVEIPM